MRLLLDTCVWGGAVEPLVAAGHDVIWVGDWPEDPGDAAILGQAFADGRILVTLDKDFGELAVLHGMPHAGIVRLVNWSAVEQSGVCIRALNLYGAELQAGALVTAEQGRFRVR